MDKNSIIEGIIIAGVGGIIAAIFIPILYRYKELHLYENR